MGRFQYFIKLVIFFYYYILCIASNNIFMVFKIISEKVGIIKHLGSFPGLVPFQGDYGYCTVPLYPGTIHYCM